MNQCWIPLPEAQKNGTPRFDRVGSPTLALVPIHSLERGENRQHMRRRHVPHCNSSIPLFSVQASPNLVLVLLTSNGCAFLIKKKKGQLTFNTWHMPSWPLHFQISQLNFDSSCYLPYFSNSLPDNSAPSKASSIQRSPTRHLQLPKHTSQGTIRIDGDTALLA